MWRFFRAERTMSGQGGAAGRGCHDILFRKERKEVAHGWTAQLHSAVAVAFGVQRNGHLGAEHNVLFTDILYVRELVVDVGERCRVLRCQTQLYIFVWIVDIAWYHIIDFIHRQPGRSGYMLLLDRGMG